MPPRRSHKKSRAGCRRCKNRKIKCDEVHPRCGNCVRHGVPCDFEDSAIASTLQSENPGAASSPNSNYELDHNNSSPTLTSPLLASGTPPTLVNPTTLYKDPGAFALRPTTSENHRMMELRLLHHWSTCTGRTVSTNNATSPIWADQVPQVAFSSSPHLVDALLSVAALHLRSKSPNDQNIIHASHAYMASTISQYAATLRDGITAENAESIFLTSSLIAFSSTASRMFVRDDSGDVRDRRQGYTLPLSWFHSFQGVKAIVASSWQFLRGSDIVTTIIEAQPPLNLNMSSQGPTFFGHLLDGLDEELDRLDTNSAGRQLTQQAYRHAVAVLNWAHKTAHMSASMIFLSIVSRRFLELLTERRPRAMVILACQFACLRTGEHIWWIRGIARREVMGIVSLFDPHDEKWWPKLQWPIRIVLYDGDIPSDVWGAALHHNHQNQPRTGNSYMSHIDMFLQLNNSMDNSKTVNPPADSLDETTYAGVESKVPARNLLGSEGIPFMPSPIANG